MNLEDRINLFSKKNVLPHKTHGLREKHDFTFLFPKSNVYGSKQTFKIKPVGQQARKQNC